MSIRVMLATRSFLRGCGGVVAVGLGYSALEAYDSYGNVTCVYSSSNSNSASSGDVKGNTNELSTPDLAALSPSSSFWNTNVIDEGHRYHLQVFHVPLPIDTSNRLLEKFDTSKSTGESSHRVGNDISLQTILALVNSFTFRMELCGAAFVCLGPIAAARCLWRTSLAQCVDFEKSPTAQRIQNNDRWKNVSNGWFGPWDIIEFPEEQDSAAASITPPASATTPASTTTRVQRTLGKELQLVFTPLAQRTQSSLGSAAPPLRQGDSFPLFTLGCPLEAMAARILVVAADAAADSSETSKKQHCVLQFSHIIYPFDQLERGSSAEQQTLRAHDVFCRVIAAQMCKSLARLTQ